MIHLPDLVKDLGFILITAAIVSLLFKGMRQPIVLGYLIAGVLVGSHFPFLPNVTEMESVKVWAEIGVIFLLFSLGLEFSFKKLASVGKAASITAIFEVVFMLGVGFLTGQLLGWSTMDSLFLGGILSISSTTIIVRAFDELNLKGRRFVSLVFGVLIIEDLVAILLLVLLSTVAVTKEFAGGEIFYSTLKLGFFLTLWFVVGIFLLPIFLRRIRKLLNDETTLIISIGLCLLMVILATKSGFSPALGAFVMGSILAETREGKHIEHLLTPVKNLFAAVFFVSVGMLIDPTILVEYFWVILLITFITIVGKLLSTSIGAILAGQTLKHSIQSGMSLAQIGEFSFIIATLGLTLKVTSEFLYPIAVAVSAITTFTTPYLIKVADPFYFWMEKKLPRAFLNRLQKYHELMSMGSTAGPLKLMWDAYGVKIVLNTTVVIGLVLGSSTLLLPYISSMTSDYFIVSTVVGVLTFIIVVPFLWAIVMGSPSQESLTKIENIRQLRALQFGVTIFRVLVGLLLFAFVISQFVSLKAASGIIIVGFTLFALSLGRYPEILYGKFEERFVLNLSEKERAELVNHRQRPTLAPWDATLAEFTLSPNSPLIAKTLMESKIKENYGVTVALIERGDTQLLAPGREDRLLPFDQLHLIGTDEQLSRVKEVIEYKKQKNVETDQPTTYGLESLLLDTKSQFTNKTIRDCGLRETIHGLIVGIERAGQRVLSPDSSMKLLEGDLVWIVGDKRMIKKLKSL